LRFDDKNTKFSKQMGIIFEYKTSIEFLTIDKISRIKLFDLNGC